MNFFSFKTENFVFKHGLISVVTMYLHVALSPTAVFQLSKPPVVETPLSQAEQKPDHELDQAPLVEPMTDEVIVKEMIQPVEVCVF